MAAYAEAAQVYGNPSSLHTPGRASRRIVEEARERLAVGIGATPPEVVFTSGGTEGDNLAIKGIYWARRDANPDCRRILVSSVEHSAVRDAVDWLAKHEGAEVVTLPVDGMGRLDLEATARAIAEAPDRIALVSVMWANNETGTLQPVAEVVEMAHAFAIPVHSDGVQAVGTVPIDIAASGVDAFVLTGHKCGGPVGSGAIVVRRGTPLVPLVHGGGQEFGLRSGTSNKAGVAALSVAVANATAAQPAEFLRIAGLRHRLVSGLLEQLPDATLHGPPGDEGRLPGIANLRIPGCEGDSLLYLLDAAGVACSTGSACQAGVPQASHVLTAMGVDPDDARGALRFSLGATSTSADVDHLLSVIGPVIDRARTAGLASARH